MQGGGRREAGAPSIDPQLLSRWTSATRVSEVHLHPSSLPSQPSKSALGSPLVRIQDLLSMKSPRSLHPSTLGSQPTYSLQLSSQHLSCGTQTQSGDSSGPRGRICTGLGLLSHLLAKDPKLKSRPARDSDADTA